MLRVGCVLSVLCIVVGLPTENHVTSRSSRNMLEAIASAGYTSETHQVTTEDGYILTMYRIPYARGQTSGDGSRPVVFCMHGLYGQSQNFIIQTPEYAVGYNLADAGFDVWFGNYRGNVHSRAHVTLDPDQDTMEFFDFSWDEIGIYDLPAMIDYILDTTGKEKLHYVGHSQGGTVFLVLGSMRPEYNEKMASVHLLAGVGYQRHFPNEELKNVATFTDIIYGLALSMGLVEFTPDLVEGIFDQIGGGVTRADLCFGDIRYRYMCELVGAKHFMRETNDTNMPEFGGGSLKQIAHYGQNIRDRIFRRFDLGSIPNQELYGDSTPPLYDLGLITSNVVMHYTVSDDLLDEQDVLDMVADMPNTIARKVARESFEHNDFIAADDAKELVTDYIIAAINNVHNGGASNEDPPAPTSPPDITPVTLPDSAVTTSLSMIFKLYILLFVVYSMF